MASLEGRLIGLLTEVKGLTDALDDEVKERRRDHDELTRIVEKYGAMAKVLDGFIQERTFDRGRIEGNIRDIEEFKRRLTELVEWKTAREKEALPVRVDDIGRKLGELLEWKAEREKSSKFRTEKKLAENQEANEDRRRIKWELVVALVAGILCTGFGVWLEHTIYPKEGEKPRITAPTPGNGPLEKRSP